MSQNRLQSRGFSKPPERLRLRDQDREPQKLARDDVSFVGGPLQAIPKTEPKRNRALLDMANGRPCLLCPPGRCSCTPGSVVACHSNLGAHGKSLGRKADDQFTVWGGDFAHKWLDQSAATAARKEMMFMAGHLRQVLEWRRIATDPSEPERFRKAAQWALDQLGATPVGAMNV